MLPSAPRPPALLRAGPAAFRLALCLCAALPLAACGGGVPLNDSVPVLWPLSDRAGPLPAYPTVTGYSPQDCPAVDSLDGAAPAKAAAAAAAGLTAAQAAAQQTLFCAQQRAATVAAHFAAEQRTLEAAQNGETLALVGLGTAAGVTGIVSQAIVPVRNLGLAAAALAGLGSSLGLSGQRAAYQAAAASVACLIRTDAALDVAAQGIIAPMAAMAGMAGMAMPPAPNPRTPITAELGRMAVARSTAMETDVHSAGAMTLSALFSGMTARTPDDTATLGMQSAARAVTASESAASADTALVSATADATDPIVRARTLHNAVAAVESSLADSLYKNVDVSKIYATAKAGFSKIGGAVSSAQHEAMKSAGKAADRPAAPVASMAAQANPAMMRNTPMLMMAPGAQTPMTPAAALSTASAMAAMHAGAAQKLSDTVASCSGDAPSAPASGSGTAAGGAS